MDIRDKIKYVKNFFRGKDSNLHPIEYMPVKTIMWFATEPDTYIDQDDKSKTYTPEEMVELEKKYFLLHINIVKTQEEKAISAEADRKLKALRGNIPE